MKSASLTLVYADSGAGKTSLIESLATYLYKKEGKRTRLVTGDGGGWDTISHLVEAGIVIPWQVDLHEHPFETLMLASEGYWPEDTGDPRSKLIPPFTVTYKGTCRKCKKVIWNKDTRPGAGMVCGTCKGKIGTGENDIKVESSRVVNPLNDLSGIKGYCFEGLTAFGSKFIASLTDRGAHGEKIGADAPAKFMDGTSKFASSNMTYFGIAQNRLAQMVNSSRLLPDMHVYWTALQMRATDQDTKQPIFGPELVGKAKTASAPAWFGNTLSLVEWPMPGNDTERRLYLSTYYDDENKTIPHVCKNRIPAVVSKGVPKFLTPIPSATKPWGLGEFLELVASKTEEARKLYGDAFVGKGNAPVKKAVK